MIAVPLGDLAAGVGPLLARDLDAALVDQPPRLVAREVHELLGDEPVEPVRARGGEAFLLHQALSGLPPGRTRESTASANTPTTIEESATLKEG